MSKTNKNPNRALIFLIWYLMRQITMADLAEMFGVRKQTGTYHAERELLRIAHILQTKSE